MHVGNLMLMVRFDGLIELDAQKNKRPMIQLEGDYLSLLLEPRPRMVSLVRDGP